MDIKKETREYIIKGVETLLASLPDNDQLLTDFISSKRPGGIADDESIPSEVEGDMPGHTVFFRGFEDELVMKDYQVKGFLKEALKCIQASAGVAQANKKVDNYVFVTPRTLPIMRYGKTIGKADFDLQRPLRAMTMRGERTSLVSSEAIQPPWELRFSITILDNKESGKSAAVDFEKIEAALDYGRYKGLGQWRNAGYGSFEWERVDSEK